MPGIVTRAYVGLIILYTYQIRLKLSSPNYLTRSGSQIPTVVISTTLYLLSYGTTVIIVL